MYIAAESLSAQREVFTGVLIFRSTFNVDMRSAARQLQTKPEWEEAKFKFSQIHT